MSARNVIAKVKRALKAGDAAQWEAAEGMAELKDDYGFTQPEIGAEFDLDRSTISRYLACWELKVSAPAHALLSFSEAYAKVVGRTPGGYREVPKTPEKQAALVANLLKNKQVADDRAVQQEQARAAERRHRERERELNRELGIPTRTQDNQARRLHSNVENQFYWRTMLAKVEDAIRAMNDANNELDRSGLPRSGSGEIIRKVRTLARAAERFGEAASSAGIGSAM